ncbi:MAG: hypothetical protein ACKPE3_13220 [Sphaerospermopsis kisseleviana]
MDFGLIIGHGAWGMGHGALGKTLTQSPVPSDALSLSKCPQSPVTP